MDVDEIRNGSHPAHDFFLDFCVRITFQHLRFFFLFAAGMAFDFFQFNLDFHFSLPFTSFELVKGSGANNTYRGALVSEV